METHCSACQGINIESLSQPNGYQHRSTGALLQSSKQCQVCSLILSALREGFPSSLSFDWHDTWSLSLRLSDGAWSQVRIRAQDDQGPPCDDVGLDVRTCANDPSTRKGIRPLLPLPKNTRAKSSFATARSWITECIAGHTQGHDSTHAGEGLQSLSTSSRPKRLVLVQRCVPGLMLKLVNPSSSVKAYTALSHCWGSGPWPWITTKANLHQREAGFSVGELPPTIRDACLATLELDIPYIWIDCLCIVQDDFEEWTLEAPKMGRIYNASTVTISATSSSSSEAGLFNAESSKLLPFPADTNVAVESQLSCGTTSTLYFEFDEWTNIALNAWSEVLGSAPLLSRAWVAQERMSARRILHYTTTQMFWECKHCIASEDNALLYSDVQWVNEARMLFTDFYRPTNPGLLNVSTNKILITWYLRFVEEIYSRCKLTFGRDKLVAISGLAKLVHNRTNLPYFAGHWALNTPWFIDSLCWSRDSPGAKALEYRGPSWSWCSQDTAVRFFGQIRSFGCSALSHTYLAQITNLHVEPRLPATTTFGLLAGGEMIVQGRLLVRELHPISFARIDDISINAGSPDAEYHFLDDDCALPPPSTLAYALALRSLEDNDVHNVDFLIVSPAEPASNTMRRIGYGLVHFYVDWAQELLQAPITTVRVI